MLCEPHPKHTHPKQTHTSGCSDGSISDRWPTANASIHSLFNRHWIDGPGSGNPAASCPAWRPHRALTSQSDHMQNLQSSPKTNSSFHMIMHPCIYRKSVQWLYKMYTKATPQLHYRCAINTSNLQVPLSVYLLCTIYLHLCTVWHFVISGNVLEHFLFLLLSVAYITLWALV